MRALIYARTGVGANKETINKQLTQCHYKAKQLGISKTIEYIDSGLQTGDIRPAYTQMLQDFRPEDTIIVTSLDRITRKMEEFLNLRSRYSIKFASGEDFDFSVVDSIKTKKINIAKNRKKPG